MKTRLVTVRLSDKQFARLKEIAHRESNTVSGVIRRYLKLGLEKIEVAALEF